MPDLQSPPTSDSTVSFAWFSWFRRVRNFVSELSANLTTTQDDLATLTTYVNTLPTTQGGNLKSQLLTTADSGTWTWPTGVDSVWVTAIGGGGGGTARVDGTIGGGGGGSGEYSVRMPFPRLAATTTTYSVGTGGAGGSNGTATNFGGLTWAGGQTGDNTAGRGWGGKGGGLAQTAPTSRVAGARPVNEGAWTFSGANGGGGSNLGGAAEQFPGGPTPGNGGGGASSPFGQGGSGGVGSTVPSSPSSTSYGAGGGGTSTTSVAAGAAGQNGCILLEWIG